MTNEEAATILLGQPPRELFILILDRLRAEVVDAYDRGNVIDYGLRSDFIFKEGTYKISHIERRFSIVYRMPYE